MSNANTRDFFEVVLPNALACGGSLPFSGCAELQISGHHGGTWKIDFTRKSDGTLGNTAKCTLRTSDVEFMNLLLGRLTVTDGLLQGRLELLGEVKALSQLIAGFQHCVQH